MANKVNESLLEWGPRPTLPKILYKSLDCHVSMAQTSGTQECKPHHLKALIGAAIHSTTFSGKVTADHIYKKFCKMFPDTVTPTKIMEMEKCWASWMTYSNINLWCDGTKKCLIHYGYVVEQPQRVIDIFNGHKLPCKIDHKFIQSDECHFHCI